MSMRKTATLGEISSIQAGIGFPVELQGRRFGKYPFAKVSDISNASRRGDKWIRHTNNYVDDGDLAKLRTRPVPAGAILFAKIGEAIRQNHRIMSDTPCLIDNNAMAVIPRKETVDLHYLYHYLRSVDFYPLASSTTVPSIRKSTLAALPVPLPSLNEQRRIAQVLDQADALRNKRREALALLDLLGESLFRDIFGNVLTNSRAFDDSVTLGDVSSITSGITKGRKLREGPLRSVPYLAVANVQDKKLILTEVKKIEASEEEIGRYRLLEGDLLLTEGGDPDKLGRGTLWRGEIAECIHQNHIFRVRVTANESIDPVFLNWLVSSPRGKNYFLRAAKQTTGIASINATQLRAFPLLVPPMALQKEFAAGLNSIMSMRDRYELSLAETNALFEALRTRAFRGAL